VTSMEVEFPISLPSVAGCRVLHSEIRSLLPCRPGNAPGRRDHAETHTNLPLRTPAKANSANAGGESGHPGEPGWTPD